MKIEKINDNQIRCTLTREDLETHQINLRELAYGSEKAKKLIEAIPVNTDSIILIITKVEDPEELDTRFSKFSPYKDKGTAEPVQLDGADSIIDIFQKICDAAKNKGLSTSRQTSGQTESPVKENPESEQVPNVNLIRLYTFRHLDDVIAASHGLNGFFGGYNRLYKESDDRYQLVIHQSECTPEEFNKICNILSEYAANTKFVSGMEAYYAEHMDCVVEGNALQKLAVLA